MEDPEEEAHDQDTFEKEAPVPWEEQAGQPMQHMDRSAEWEVQQEECWKLERWD